MVSYVKVCMCFITWWCQSACTCTSSSEITRAMDSLLWSTHSCTPSCTRTTPCPLSDRTWPDVCGGNDTSHNYSCSNSCWSSFTASTSWCSRTVRVQRFSTCFSHCTLFCSSNCSDLSICALTASKLRRSQKLSLPNPAQTRQRFHHHRCQHHRSPPSRLWTTKNNCKNLI